MNRSGGSVFWIKLGVAAKYREAPAREGMRPGP